MNNDKRTNICFIFEEKEKKSTSAKIKKNNNYWINVANVLLVDDERSAD
jgi:hypothetical protein